LVSVNSVFDREGPKRLLRNLLPSRFATAAIEQASFRSPPEATTL
jgi:hypothetical protein